MKPNLQPASLDIYDAKYRLRDRDGNPVDTCISDTFSRVARALADVEETGEKRAFWYDNFYWAMENGAIPAGRILSNAGAGEHKPSASLINCVVSSTIKDDMGSILDVLKEAGMLLRAGSGIGYCFSTLRPRGARVSGAGATTSGPLPFMDVYDKLCSTISSAGGRRGAQMATFDIGHPDVLEFIKAKREDGRLRQFNLSLLVSDEFMETLERDGDWHLSFPARGLPGSTVYRTVKARHIWNLVMASTYDYAEPGVLFVDRINEMNNLYFCENIQAVNPCGEQNLPPTGACLLGSVDLTKFVVEPFTSDAHFDLDRYRNVVAIFARMLDNVVEIANLPVKAYADELVRKRRHGMGYFGLGSAMAMLGYRYGDERSLKFTDEVTRTMAHENWKQALELSLEKGPAPIMEETFAEHGGAKGKHLHSSSRYMEKIRNIDNDLVEKLNRHGARFSHATSIAPTGCVDKDTLVVSENGLSRISEIGVATGDQWQQIRLSVATDRGFRQASHYFVNGSKPTIKITTSEGRQFIATPNHRIRAFCEGKLYDWIRMDEVMVGCVIPTVIDNYPECSFNDLIACSPSPSCGTFVSPSILTGEIAFVIGFLHSNGNVKTNRHIRFFHHSSYADDVFNFIERVLGECFSLRGKVFRSKCDSMKELHVYSKPLVDWLNLNGMGKNKSHDISVPKAIMMGGREVVYGYMRGLFEGDGTMGNAIALTSTSEMFLRDIQVLLQSVGIVSKFGISGNPENDGHIGNRIVYRVSINHAIDKIRFMDRIGFISIKGDKRISVSRNMNRRMMASSIRNTISDAFGVKPSKEMRYLVDFEKTSDCEFHYERIEKIESCESETFDLSVPSNTTYIANNIVSHNTISLSIGNNASNGIEPSFAHEYTRNVIVDGKKAKESVKVYSLEALVWRELHGDQPLPEHCVTADQISPEDHIAVQAAAQKWIDSSISKTINVPSDISFERFNDIYTLAYKSGLKGCATFRFNPERFQGVLVKESDLKNTVYRFEMDNGDTVDLRGDDIVEYDGEKHTAANLFDAIKEGYYGRL